MHFFRAREVADEWAKARAGVVALTLEEGWELARVHWVDRARTVCRRPSRKAPAGRQS